MTVKSTRDRELRSSSDSISSSSTLPGLFTQTSFTASSMSPNNSLSHTINNTDSNINLHSLSSNKVNNLRQALRERASCDAILEIIRLSPNSCSEVSAENGYLPHHLSAGKY